MSNKYLEKVAESLKGEDWHRDYNDHYNDGGGRGAATLSRGTAVRKVAFPLLGGLGGTAAGGILAGRRVHPAAGPLVGGVAGYLLGAAMANRHGEQSARLQKEKYIANKKLKAAKWADARAAERVGDLAELDALSSKRGSRSKS